MQYKTPIGRIEYMRLYYKTEKYKAWQRKYRKKKYHSDKAFREYCIKQTKESQQKAKK